MKHNCHVVKKTILDSKNIILLFLAFSFIPISIPLGIFKSIYVLDFLLLGIFIVYFMDICVGFKIYVISLDKYLFIIPLYAFISILLIFYYGEANFLRFKTAIGGLVMILLFWGTIFVYSNRFKSSNLLTDIAKYYCYFSFINFLYITVSLIIHGSSRGDRIPGLIESYNPSLTCVVYVYGYMLSKCLVNRKWKIGDILLLVTSSVVIFFSFYRSLWVTWVVLSMGLLLINSNNIKKSIRQMLLILMLSIFIFFVFKAIAPNSVNLMLSQSHDEVTFITQIIGTSYSNDEVNEVTNRYGASRIFLWLQAIPYIKSKPLLGNGVGYEAYLGAQKKLIIVFSLAKHPVATFHNQLLGFLVDYGLIGTFIIYFVLLKIGLLALKVLRMDNVSKRKRHSIYCFFVIYIIYIVNSFIGGEMIPSHTGLYAVIPLWLFIAAMISEYKKMRINHG
jgi:O-antigen ligase